VIHYPDEESVLEAVEQALGFPVVVRDRGLLSSAVFRPQSSYGGQDVYLDLWTKAIALGEGIARNHPLVDANKRTGWIAMVAFLAMNGVEEVLTPVEDEVAILFMLDLALERFSDIAKAAEAFRRLF
jgi:death-on-curing protein